MINLKIKRTSKSPEIDFNAQTGVLKIIGASIPEDTAQFYQHIYDWLDEYTLNPQRETLMIFQLDYYNTGQSYYIVKIFRKLEALNNKDKEQKVSVQWYFDEDDDDMEGNGKDFRSITTLEMELIMISC